MFGMRITHERSGKRRRARCISRRRAAMTIKMDKKGGLRPELCLLFGDTAG